MNPLVLIVDDAPDVLLTTEIALGAQGYRTATSMTGQSAEEAWLDQEPDIVLLDVNLPDANGIELCNLWKSMQDRAHVPIILRSAVSVSGAEQVLGLQGGADGYLTEPTEPEVLVATVDAHLRIRELRHEIQDANDAAETLLSYSIELARAHSPADVVTLLKTAATAAVGACEVRLDWRPTGLRQRRSRPNPGKPVTILDALVSAGISEPTFFRSDRDLPTGLEAAEGQSSWAVLPIDAVDMDATLVVASAAPQPFSELQQKFFITLMNLTSLSLARTSSLALHRSISDTLQAALLPAVDLAESVILERQLIVAHGETMAGGDWLDAFTLENGNQIVLLGDVVGHGAVAAGQSSVIRHTLRTLLLTGYSLPEALYLADRLVNDQAAESQGSVLGIEVQTEDGVARVVSCGHPPPIVCSDSGEISVLQVEPHPLVGFGLVESPPAATDVDLSTSSLVLLTDGLIERHDQPIDDGYSIVIDALKGRSAPQEIMTVLTHHADRNPLHDDALFAVCRFTG